MKIQHFLLSIILISTLSSITVKADIGLFDSASKIFVDKIKDLFEKYMSSVDENGVNQMQLKFIQQFLKSIALGEIRLYDWALHQKDQVKIKEMKAEVDGFIEAIFQGKYSTLSQLIQEIRKENPSELKGRFSEDTFMKDIQDQENQQILVNAIVNKLFEQYGTKEALVQSFKDLDSLKKFLIKYKNVNESDIDLAMNYLKDVKKIQKSLELVLQKLTDEQMRNKLVNIFMKMAKSQASGQDILEIFYTDSQLSELLIDTDWETLIKLKDQIYAYGGKAYQEYQKKRDQEEKSRQENKQNQDQDEDDEEEEGEGSLQNDKSSDSSMSLGKIILIIASIAFVISLVFVGMRKYRQAKAGDSGFHDERYYVNSNL
ncbi:transmembrane protein, putative (macronuclear) [Tetrahymena thermophila SB210]|uniref:Transmembrane protein, putative n=1 Tax=Tetrahymena thermophila (strain SB210) TaxID=312017 RepID=Q22MT8_TETTS|nr:transmembrane protein, putative [Tetrahymena thermophila SB210]EAR86386.2 transmembrane protein, putative [Tetrahymena thermophila SB210]|eukprot:XP_976932.2 transmembrane protein, putative [Tetrahymena thermophila SB210]